MYRTQALLKSHEMSSKNVGGMYHDSCTLTISFHQKRGSFIDNSYLFFDDNFIDFPSNIQQREIW